MASVNTNTPAQRAARKAETGLTTGKTGTNTRGGTTRTRAAKGGASATTATTTATSPLAGIKAPDGRSFVPMAKYFAAIGESPIRARMLWWLSQSGVPIGAEPFAASTRIKDAPAHLAALARAGLVNVEGKGTTATYYLSGVGRMFAESIVRNLADGGST